MSDKLKPCPFCGGKAARMLNGNEDNYFWWVECSNCNATIDNFATSAEAVATWNTRVDDASISEKPAPSLKELTEDTQVLTDSREHLLDYIWREITTTLCNNGRLHDPNIWYANIVSWLDRQAAITERECMERATSERVGWDCAECAEGLGRELDARCDPLKERIAKLTAERDLWNERARQAHDYAFELTLERDELQAERDRLKKRLENQAAYIAGVEDNLCRCESQLVRDGKDIDELQAEIKQERIEWESERDYADLCEKRLNELTAERDILEARLAGKPECEICDRTTMLVEIEGLTAERDEWRARAEQVQESYLDAKDSRDNLQEAIDAMGNRQFYAMYRKVCTERDELKHDRETVWCDCDCCGWQKEREQMQRVIHTQAESFKNMEAELKSAIDALGAGI